MERALPSRSEHAAMVTDRYYEEFLLPPLGICDNLLQNESWVDYHIACCRPGYPIQAMLIGETQEARRWTWKESSAYLYLGITFLSVWKWCQCMSPSSCAHRESNLLLMSRLQPSNISTILRCAIFTCDKSVAAVFAFSHTLKWKDQQTRGHKSNSCLNTVGCCCFHGV